MSIDPATAVGDWRSELPVLTGRSVALREPAAHDLRALFDVLSTNDAARLGLEEPVEEDAVRELIDRFACDRRAGVAFTYAIIMSVSDALVGVIQVRRLDTEFNGAQWECTLTPSARGTGLFLEAACLVGSFAFGFVGAHRLEARVLLQNGRASGALRKLGAVQEGVLRGSRRPGGEYADHVLWSILKEDWGHRWVSTVPRVH